LPLATNLNAFDQISSTWQWQFPFESSMYTLSSFLR
jgi:hypothetical protein